MPDAKERYQTHDQTSLAEVAALLASARHAALATADADGPYAALVAFALDAGGDGVLLHLSDLSPHKAHLRVDARCALMVAGPGSNEDEVLRLRRLTLRGRAAVLPRTDAAYEAAKARYLAKYPDHALMFSLGDFDLVRLRPASGVYIAGFGRAYPVDEAVFRAAVTTEAAA